MDGQAIVGLSALMVGGVLVLWAQAQMDDALQSLPEASLADAASRLGTAGWDFAPMAAALVVGLVTMGAGFRLGGLAVSLVLFAVTLGRIGVRRVREAPKVPDAPPTFVAAYRRGAVIYTVGTWIAFLGLGVFVVR